MDTRSNPNESKKPNQNQNSHGLPSGDFSGFFVCVQARSLNSEGGVLPVCIYSISSEKRCISFRNFFSWTLLRRADPHLCRKVIRNVFTEYSSIKRVITRVLTSKCGKQELSIICISLAGSVITHLAQVESVRDQVVNTSLSWELPYKLVDGLTACNTGEVIGSRQFQGLRLLGGCDQILDDTVHSDWPYLAKTRHWPSGSLSDLCLCSIYSSNTKRGTLKKMHFIIIRNLAQIC